MRWKTFNPKKIYQTGDETKKGILTEINIPEFTERIIPHAERVYFIVNENVNEEIRGKHYHFASSEILFCARGTAYVEIHSRKECSLITINPDNAIFIPQICWHAVKLEKNTILVAIAEKTEDRAITINELLDDCQCQLCGELLSYKKEIALAIQQ